MSFTLTQVLAALDKLANDSPRGKLTFVYRTESLGPGVAGTVSCDYEAILYANWTSSVVLNVLGNLGYTQAAAYDRLHEWVNDARSDLGTDWAFGFIVVDNSTDTTRGRASAYITGPAAWLFQHYPSNVYHHETGHTWGARDEYHPDAAQSPTSLAGYTQEVNANSQYNDGTGYFGGAGEGITGADDLATSTTSAPGPAAPGALGPRRRRRQRHAGHLPQCRAERARAARAPSPSPARRARRRSSARRVRSPTPTSRSTASRASSGASNGGPWQDATASDGSLQRVLGGLHLHDAGAAQRRLPVRGARHATTSATRRRSSPGAMATVSGSGTTNNSPLPALAVTPTLGSTATNFQLDAVGSRDAEDATSLQYRWD